MADRNKEIIQICGGCNAPISNYTLHIGEDDVARCYRCLIPVSHSMDFEPFALPSATSVSECRVLIVLHGFHVCGVARLCLNRAQLLREKGCYVSALAVRGGGIWSDKFAGKFDELLFLRRPSSKIPPWLRQDLNNFAWVEAHYQPAISWAVAEVPKHIPLDVYFHTEPMAAFDDREILKAALHRARNIEFPSEFLRHAYSEVLTNDDLPLFNERAIISPNKVSADLALPTKSNLATLLNDLGKPSRRLGIVTRLDADKTDTELLLHTLEQTFNRLPDLFVAIAGIGEELQSTMEKVYGTLGQSRVRFLGYVEDVQSIYKWADVLFLPSWTEVVPFSVLEAAHFGKATVMPALPGLVSVFADLAAMPLTFTPSDSSSATNQICEYLSGSRQARRRSRI